jgi:uncharacterized membrane protein YkvA (DUF1232 family)
MAKLLLILWRTGRRDLRLLWLALRHPRRPFWLLPALAILALYALDPLNFVLPVVGAVDEFVVVPLALHALLKFLPSEIGTADARK